MFLFIMPPWPVWRHNRKISSQKNIIINVGRVEVQLLILELLGRCAR